MQDIPYHVLLKHVMVRLDVCDLYTLSLTNRLYSKLLADDKLWNCLVERDFSLLITKYLVTSRTSCGVYREYFKLRTHYIPIIDGYILSIAIYRNFLCFNLYLTEAEQSCVIFKDHMENVLSVLKQDMYEYQNSYWKDTRIKNGKSIYPIRVEVCTNHHYYNGFHEITLRNGNETHLYCQRTMNESAVRQVLYNIVRQFDCQTVEDSELFEHHINRPVYVWDTV